MFKNIISHRHWNKYYTSHKSAPVLYHTNDIQGKHKHGIKQSWGHSKDQDQAVYDN